MRIETFNRYAKGFIKKYRLSGWVLEINKDTETFGWCDTDNKILSFSDILIRLNKKSVVKKIILHEIAHAITGDGHTKRWREKLLKMGGDGLTNYGPDVVMQGEKYMAKCDCGATIYKKRPIICSCPYCSKGKYDPIYKLFFNKII
jgi:predicted SprT family Zn-dependent metalloprotease